MNIHLSSALLRSIFSFIMYLIFISVKVRRGEYSRTQSTSSVNRRYNRTAEGVVGPMETLLVTISAPKISRCSSPCSFSRCWLLLGLLAVLHPRTHSFVAVTRARPPRWLLSGAGGAAVDVESAAAVASPPSLDDDDSGVLGRFCAAVARLAGRGMDDESLGGTGVRMMHSNDYSQFSNWYSESSLEALKGEMEALLPEPNAATEHARRWWPEEVALSPKQLEQKQQREERERQQQQQQQNRDSDRSSDEQRSLADVLRPPGTEQQQLAADAEADDDDDDDGIGAAPRGGMVGNFRVPLQSG